MGIIQEISYILLQSEYEEKIPDNAIISLPIPAFLNGKKVVRVFVRYKASVPYICFDIDYHAKKILSASESNKCDKKIEKNFSEDHKKLREFSKEYEEIFEEIFDSAFEKGLTKSQKETVKRYLQVLKELAKDSYGFYLKLSPEFYQWLKKYE